MKNDLEKDAVFARKSENRKDLAQAAFPSFGPWQPRRVMATADQFPTAPPLRFELTEEQVADLERAKPPGAVALVVGYAERHRWPEPEKFTLWLRCSACHLVRWC